MSLTDRLGHNDAEWMSDPNRNCAPPPDCESPLPAAAFTDSWFPTDGNERRAKRLCAGCPQRVACLLFALERPELDGVWGASTTAERELMRKNGAA